MTVDNPTAITGFQIRRDGQLSDGCWTSNNAEWDLCCKPMVTNPLVVEAWVSSDSTMATPMEDDDFNIFFLSPTVTILDDWLDDRGLHLGIQY